MASIVKSLRLLADPTRLRLLLLLEQGELSVVELQEILGMGQSRISSHLAQLKAAKLVLDRRAGKNIYYGLQPITGGAGEPFREIVRASAKEIPEAPHDRVALRMVLKKRQDTAREYFDRLAGKLGRSYSPGRTWQGLAHMLFALLPQITVADLGAGEGTLAQLIAKNVRKVIAVDNSEKMVEVGAALAVKHGIKNLEYRLGDLQEPPIAPKSVDLAILSQALHHAVDPARAIEAAYHTLKPGGRIAILDLLSHSFEQGRELYADLWLGFSEVDLRMMLEKARFTKIEVSVVAREAQSPHFQTVFATAVRGEKS